MQVFFIFSFGRKRYLHISFTYPFSHFQLRQERDIYKYRSPIHLAVMTGCFIYTSVIRFQLRQEEISIYIYIYLSPIHLAVMLGCFIHASVLHFQFHSCKCSSFSASAGGDIYIYRSPIHLAVMLGCFIHASVLHFQFHSCKCSSFSALAGGDIYIYI